MAAAAGKGTTLQVASRPAKCLRRYPLGDRSTRGRLVAQNQFQGLIGPAR